MHDPDLSDIFAHIDRRREEYLSRLIDYVRQPSISAHGTGIAETAELIAGVLDGLGMAAEVVPTDGWPMVFAQRADAPGRPTVLLYGHYDVQPPDPLEEWVSPPFRPEVRDGRIYGRGVGDNKGQHLAQILAL
ncbi:M20/M25/M40 family metallo-hydrolase, partial [Oscillochloris sp. ZM17-4]|uniref:M20/M25/M40 family metallo-hydrolase n=1 Tax=Oscillochloris sp. ZM17-4 TaxID=2866714 RepID=UPI001C72BD7A